ncbi:MAG TPA: bifunctional 3-hydroxydecanoyl-ACP dehydratase/trans-2-decenoyl-ACP isomerase [Vicinamibacterales bacterium]|nr:bifunctional 3-hydroxydecanoyl-ACP dehydratase/trans-2-decenoyl-ACP isomerase [Vicinamibacterales bacterium]
MTHAEFCARRSFNKEELLAFGHGTLIADPPAAFTARLPIPPFLMIDRIVEIERDGARGRLLAERDVHLDDWFFQCHFANDPVQPGCLGLDAVWQLLGFYGSWTGALGSGRALGCGEVEFSGQIRPRNEVVRYDVRIVRFTALPSSSAAIVIGDATVAVDGEPIYEIKRAKVGLFQGIGYDDYPLPSPRSRGGRVNA